MFTFKRYWVKDEPLAIGPCPNPNALSAAVEALISENVDLVVSMQTESEAASLGLDTEAGLLAAAGIAFWRLPITDHRTPPFTDETFALIDRIATALNDGKRAYLHCFAGIGRSATIAAGVLVRRGHSAENALRLLSAARGFEVPETTAQQNWIYDYQTYRQSLNNSK